MHKLKNITGGPKGVNLTNGRTVYIVEGTTEEGLDISKDELKVLKETGWFQIDGDVEADAKPDDGENAKAASKRAAKAEKALDEANAKIAELEAQLEEATKPPAPPAA